MSNEHTPSFIWQKSWFWNAYVDWTCFYQMNINLFIWHVFYFHAHLTMSKMVIMSIWHSEAYSTCLCWIANVNVEWTNCEFTCTSWFDMFMSFAHVDAKWTSCSHHMDFLSIFFGHVFTRCQMHMSNEHPFCIYECITCIKFTN